MDSNNEKVDRLIPVFVAETLQIFDKVNVSRKARYLMGQASGMIAMARQFRMIPPQHSDPSLHSHLVPTSIKIL